MRRSAPVTHSSGGSFTLGRAAHDAGRVLTVGAGVALIALAVLVPVGLVAALAWWIGSVGPPAPARARARHGLVPVRQARGPAARGWSGCGISDRWRRRVRRRLRCCIACRCSRRWARMSWCGSPTWRCRAASARARSCSARGTRATRATSCASGHARAIREHPDGRSITLATFGPGRHLRRAGDVRRREPIGHRRDAREH